MPLPGLDYVFFVHPLGDTVLSCAGTTVDSDHYLLLTRPAREAPFTIQNLHPGAEGSRLLVLLLSPGFVQEMAGFLNIPADLRDLFHGVPLAQGDAISNVLTMLTDTLHDTDQTEELFLEVVGQVLRLLRLRHQALLSLSSHKRNTVDDLLPRLLEARQFIEARYLQPIKTRDVAEHVALSEYHFARLFKTAFEVTVHQFVLRLRLNEARYLLEGSDLSVTEIALEVGYNSLSAFINAFRKYFAMPPSDYRTQLQN